MKLMLVMEGVDAASLGIPAMLDIYDNSAKWALAERRAVGFTIGERHIIDDPNPLTKTIVWEIEPVNTRS